MANVEREGYNFYYNDESGNRSVIKFASMPDFKYRVVKVEDIFDFEKGTAIEALGHMSLFEVREFFFNSNRFQNIETDINTIRHNTY